jgi:hypothetical protein
MSSISRWSFTAKATLWRPMISSRNGDISGWEVLGSIDCDYASNFRLITDSLGREKVARNTFWTEYADAKEGDRIIIGESDELTPPAYADEILVITRDADTFDRIADDYTYITGL